MTCPWVAHVTRSKRCRSTRAPAALNLQPTLNAANLYSRPVASMGKGERPEHMAPPEVFYNDDEARKYTTNSRMMAIQVRSSFAAG